MSIQTKEWNRFYAQKPRKEFDMKTNNVLIQLALLMIIIFGGVFILRFLKNGEILLDQLIGVSIGLIILIGSLIWRKRAIIKSNK